MLYYNLLPGIWYNFCVPTSVCFFDLERRTRDEFYTWYPVSFCSKFLGELPCTDPTLIPFRHMPSGTHRFRKTSCIATPSPSPCTRTPDVRVTCSPIRKPHRVPLAVPPSHGNRAARYDIAARSITPDACASTAIQ